jgi:hypothetical protein
MKFDYHMILVSEQTTPNLVPLLDESNRPKGVVMVVSPQMEVQAQWLTPVIRRKGLLVERIDVPDAFDYFQMENAILEWLSAHADQQVALNVTGGTKPMAMAAQSAFLMAGKPVFYVSDGSDQILWLSEKMTTRARIPEKIKIPEYLEIHGYSSPSIGKPSVPSALRDLAQALAANARVWGGALGALNFLAHGAKNKLKTNSVPSHILSDEKFQQVTELFASNDLLRWSAGCITFPSESARQFVNGGWLEFHTYKILADLAPKLGFVDYGTNVVVQAKNGETKNEIDAAFMHGNHLHIIECKTANLTQISESGETKVTDVLYKLDSLLRIGGKRTYGMLIDFRGGLSSYDLGRAAHLNIEIVSAQTLPRLEERITAWVQKTTPVQVGAEA